MTIHPDPVPFRVDERGDIRIGQSRVLLDTIVNHFHQGLTPDDIAGGFPTISRADVYAVLAYYLRHQAELDEYLRRRDEEGEEIRRKIEATQEGFLAEMKARRQAWQAQRSAAEASPAD